MINFMLGIIVGFIVGVSTNILRQNSIKLKIDVTPNSNNDKNNKLDYFA